MKTLPSILRRDVSTSLAIVVLFGVGIGLFVTVLGWIHGLLLPRLPFDEPEEIVAVTSRDLASGETSLEFSAADGSRWLSGAESFEATAAFSMFRAPVTDPDGGARFWVAAGGVIGLLLGGAVLQRLGEAFQTSSVIGFAVLAFGLQTAVALLALLQPALAASSADPASLLREE